MDLKAWIFFGFDIILLIWGIVQYVTAKKEEENTRNRIRDWQNASEGIKNALLGIALNPNDFSDKKDIAKAVQAVAQNAISLDQAFVQERFYTDTEIKVKREEKENETKRLFNQIRK